MEEAIAIMRRVWSDDPASFHGDHYAFDDIKVQPKPAHRIPIWIGGGSQATYDRAARCGDGFQAISMQPGDLAPIVDSIRERVAAARPDDDFVVSYRTGWDPQGMDPAQIRDERDAYADAGVDHVVSAPWQTDVDAWIRSMELLVEIIEPELVGWR
jgi:alkanesulfonate monooxygenase SsuD/methylene tetrahydromethanopterin reductase-like flavin-dependent oxidoreductase (luciferase family)